MLRGCRYERIDEMKEAVSKVIDTLIQEDFPGVCWNCITSALQPEEITSEGLVFHMCTINKSTHAKKVWELI